MSFPIEDLKEWFLESKRDFPWRENPTAYRVWVSEIMLQQTVASVVVGYFERWMRQFPTLKDLAQATDSEVVKAWEGLGYYSRARNLHTSAKMVMERFGGKVPSSKEELCQLKGIGSYTQGAILSFAFHQRAVAVDGNVMRVISRFKNSDSCIDLHETKKEIEHFVESILPENESWVISEALIELGAIVCQKKAKCHECPLEVHCKGKHRSHLLPVRKEKKEVTKLFRAVAVITFEGHYLLIKGEKGKVMSDLYEFPYLEMKTKDIDEIKKEFESILGLKLLLNGVLKDEKHSFTRFRAHLFPLKFEAKEKKEGHIWEKEPKKFPFSSGHKRILDRLIDESTSH